MKLHFDLLKCLLLWRGKTMISPHQCLSLGWVHTFLRKPHNHNIQPQTKSKSKTWIDPDCHAANNNLVAKFSTDSNAEIPSEVQTLKQQYKILLMKKKQKAQKDSWTWLSQTSKSSNPATCWHSVKTELYTESPRLNYNISPWLWESHFHILCSLETDPQTSLEIQLQSLPAWPKVTVNEAEKWINQLRSGKAPGNNITSPEILKLNIDWWTTVLTELLMYINWLAHIPSDSGLTIIVIIVPVIQERKKIKPTNYFSIISKLY